MPRGDRLGAARLAFLGTSPTLAYGGIEYNTCDLYFYYRFPGGRAAYFALTDGEAAAIRHRAPSRLREEDLAFPSLVMALRR